ncbi:MAG TPA: DMT family transporter [Candidatus Sulfotelmatobacter sp.]|nr:DMT family transporter [Candidatus Sulfotelmatobacter sp.]
MTAFTLGILGGLGTGAVWATISILVRSLSGRFPVVAITVARSFLGGTLVLVLAVALGHGGEIVRMPLWVVLTLWASMLLAMGLGDTLFFASMEYLGVTRALTLSMVNPLLTTLVGVGVLGERVSPLATIGILLVVAGLALLVSGKTESAERRRAVRRGTRMVFVAACCWGSAAILMKPALRVASVVAAAAIRIPIAGIFLCLTPWMRGTLPVLRKITREERTRLAIICALSAGGSLLFTTGIKYGGVAVGNVLASTSPLFALPFEIWVLRQPQSVQTICGALVTVSGIVLLNL